MVVNCWLHAHVMATAKFPTTQGLVRGDCTSARTLISCPSPRGKKEAQEYEGTEYRNEHQMQTTSFSALSRVLKLQPRSIQHPTPGCNVMNTPTRLFARQLIVRFWRCLFEATLPIHSSASTSIDVPSLAVSTSSPHSHHRRGTRNQCTPQIDPLRSFSSS